MKPFVRLLPSLLLLLTTHCAAAAPAGDIAYRQRLGAQLPLDVMLLDETGNGLSLATLMEHKPTLLILGYFGCRRLCNVFRAETLDTLSSSDLVAGRDYLLLIVSVDPSETTDDAARAKAQSLASFPGAGKKSGWRFLTAAPDAIARVSSAVGFEYAYDETRNSFAHPVGLAVLTPNGVVSSYLLGFGVTIEAIRAALARAATEEIVTAAAPLMLVCFDFDAATSRYSLAVMKLLRFLAGGLALVVALLLLLASTRERAR
jgi:protein SCO1